jgi:hypothetical protein
MSLIGLTVYCFQMRKRILARTSFVNHPPAKLLYGLQVVIESMGTNPLAVISQCGKMPLYFTGGHITPTLEPTTSDHTADTRD